MAYVNRGFRVKYMILNLLKDEVKTLLEDGFSIKCIQKLLEDEYEFAIFYRHFRRFIKDIERNQKFL